MASQTRAHRPAGPGSSPHSGISVPPMRARDVLLEVLRSRLQAVVDEAALAIEQTAVSPIVAEGTDYSSNVLDAAGGLLVGGVD